MKIVIVSACTPRDWIIIQEIIRNFDKVAVIELTSSKNGKARKSNGWINAKGMKVIRKIHRIRLAKKLTPRFYEGLAYKKYHFPSAEVNSPEGIELIRSLEPDILFTSWAPILREAVLQIPKLAAINVHFGISPDFRGNDTLFWALYFRNYEKVGGILHYLNKGVDTGNILAEVRPSLESGNGELEVDIKTTLLLAKAAVQVLGKIKESQVIPLGKIQEKKGRNFKTSERRLTNNLKLLAFHSLGMWKVKPREERIDYFI
jgi:methionyl-tRNA formyltransferase